MKSKIIRTPTTNMSREDWLNFRDPVFHVKKHLSKLFIPLAENGFQKNSADYNVVEAYFNTDEWEAFIFPCLGASEVGTILGLNKYKSSVELYYEKVGLKSQYQDENKYMFFGKELEEFIAKLWQFWERDIETTIINYRENIIQRRCKKVNAYIQNPDCLWLFVSLDREMNKGKGGEAGPLECKTISGYAADQWESGIPPMYIAQLQTQCLVGEYNFGEMAILKDGRDYDVTPFVKHDDICENIVIKTKAFYENVKKAVENYILSLLTEDDMTRYEHLNKIDALSPDPDGSVSYENYLKEKFEDQGGELDGGLEVFYDAILYDVSSTELKKADERKKLFANKLRAYLGNRNTILFRDGGGKVTWKASKSGSRTLRVDVKYTEDLITLALAGVPLQGADIIPEIPSGLIPGVTADVPGFENPDNYPGFTPGDGVGDPPEQGCE